MKVSIIIPAFNEEKYIGKTLTSIRNLRRDGLDVEVVVVDAHSTDKTAAIAKEFGARIVNEPHLGIGFARQQGILHAGGDIVAFTDADTTVGKDWLMQHVSALQKPNVALTFGMFRVVDGRFPYYHYINYIQPLIYAFLYYFAKVPIASGQNLAFWRKKALSIGGFNDHIEVMEDIDLAVRMTKIGKVVYLPHCTVYSSGRRSHEGWQFFTRATRASILYFFFKKRNLEKFPTYR
ncbi:glycosyltransferase [Candidatus Gottesmanbacteria bacterium]|nr:glycosyltransferase [Candidatus Gottesmanbacteria bacterium]